MRKKQSIQKPSMVTESTGPVIVVKDLKKSFGEQHVLKGFNFHLDRGETLVILGRSGSGKSVLIKCIIGLMKPDEGSIEVLGNDILSMSLQDMDKLRMRVGFLFQSNALYDSMTIRENLEFPMRRHLSNLKSEEVNARVIEALTDVGLEHTIDMMPSELSGGMQKRVALARTLILKPEIILYDEPTTGLDPITGMEISNLIVEIQEKYQTSSIVISHDMKCVEITADRIAVLYNGVCYVEDTYEALKVLQVDIIKQYFD